MKPLIALLALSALTAFAAQPFLHTLRGSLAPYPLSDYPGASNSVITVYKSTSLGTVWTPFKPTAVFPATRTNFFVQVLPGTYRFYLTATLQPYGESDPSEVVTNRVAQ